VPTLVPTRVAPVAVRPLSPRGAPVVVADAAPPPLLFPSALPGPLTGIPTTLPGIWALPSSLPIALPSVLPSALSSAVPSGLPTPPASSAPAEPSSSAGPGY
jgi:hypothetical protein